jgi:uncharacterized cupin superfamily protein
MTSRQKKDRQHEAAMDRERASSVPRRRKARAASCCGWMKVGTPLIELEPGVWGHEYHAIERHGVSPSGAGR